MIMAYLNSKSEMSTSETAEKEGYLERYYQWLNNPNLDPKIKQELQNMKNNKNIIKEHFKKELDFGTGGMRGILGTGSNRFNCYVVRRATQGFANYLLDHYPEKDKKVVLAYDSRHFSNEFAENAALVLGANGIKALLFDDIRPVPVLSFAIRHVGAIGGIMITASHNPPEYNGYKVYSDDGGQCVPAVTANIEDYIERTHIFNDPKMITKEEAEKQNLLQYVGKEIDNSYMQKLKTICADQHSHENDIGIVYSPLHGAGYHLIPRLLKELGYKKIYLVKEQLTRDPDFSTVKTPNPEEKEAFQLALDLGHSKQADLLLATDPDCDRVGCAVRNQDYSYTLLNGNQMGALLLNYRLERLQQKNELSPNCTMIKTFVTGDLGKKIANNYGINTEETLTGFKYIGEKIKEYELTGERRFIFGYEESYGCLAGTFSRDKDGVITSALLVEMAAYYRNNGQTLLDKLEELYQLYGFHLDDLESIKLNELSLADHIFKIFKENPPQQIGELKIKTIKDYHEGISLDYNSGEKQKINLPGTKALCFILEDESWFCIRPSGTEPKLKIYYSTIGENQDIANKKMNLLKKEVKKRIDAYN